MPNETVECVPNFSEGRDLSVIDRIAGSISSVRGVNLLHIDPGRDANRTVMTFVGAGEAVAEAAFQAIAAATELIDMRHQRGTHPRLGATDVCPFVPLDSTSMQRCVAIARHVGQRVGEELGVPVYLYEAAGRSGRTNLADIRHGEYEGLPAKLADPFWKPDFGPARFVPKSGAAIIGARDFLIAYNITLDTKDRVAASDIAHELRERGRFARARSDSSYYYKGEPLFYHSNAYPCGNCDFVGRTWNETAEHCLHAHDYDLNRLGAETIPGFPHVIGQKVRRAGLFKYCKAIGWYADEYGRAQISTNLTNYRVTPPHVVFDAAKRLAEERGITVTGSELVGLIPFQPLFEAGMHYLELEQSAPALELPVRQVLEAAVSALGLNDVRPFDLEKKILGLHHL